MGLRGGLTYIHLTEARDNMKPKHAKESRAGVSIPDASVGRYKSNREQKTRGERSDRLPMPQKNVRGHNTFRGRRWHFVDSREEDCGKEVWVGRLPPLTPTLLQSLHGRLCPPPTISIISINTNRGGAAGGRVRQHMVILRRQ